MILALLSVFGNVLVVLVMIWVLLCSSLSNFYCKRQWKQVLSLKLQ